MSMHDDIKTVLVSEEELTAKVAELGGQISRDYEGKNLVLVSILKGSVVFMADLMRAVEHSLQHRFYGGVQLRWQQHRYQRPCKDH